MTEASYKNFIEKIIALLEKQVNGKVGLRHNNYGVSPYYDIMVQFKSTDIQIALECALGGDVWDAYAECKAHPDKADELVKECARGMVNCLKTNILEILFEN